MRTKTKLLLASIILLVLVVLWFLLSPNSKSQRPIAPSAVAAINQEFEKIQGTWEFVSVEVSGLKKPDQDFKKLLTVVKGNQWTGFERTNIAARCEVELDPETNLKNIDFYPPPDKGLPIHGIYRLEGDQLTVFDRGENNGERPTEFKSEPGSGVVAFVLRRVNNSATDQK